MDEYEYDYYEDTARCADDCYSITEDTREYAEDLSYVDL